MTGLTERATAFSGDVSGPNINRRVALVGTRSALASLAPQFAFGVGLAKPIGALILDGGGQAQPLTGIPLIGSFDELARLHHSEPISLALVCVPATETPLFQRANSELRGLGIPTRAVTPLADLLAAEHTHVPRPVGGIDLAALVGRTPHTIDRGAVAGVLNGKRVLVTGAGGSIGSEICRIAASFQPESILLVERSENALFEIDRQLARRFPGVARKAVLHDIADADQTLHLFLSLQPHVVFHAAAHKHVPLMEDHPSHAVTNNLFGTKSVADAAMAVGAERFVMISSDKAVNPSSVMGATKRLAEMYVQSLGAAAGLQRTSFSMVRFGNVLGSACSVLPIWQAQLDDGGPVTVTDARMTRYFMTIHEAAALVIQSAAIDCRGGTAPCIQVLDMGEPVRILDLARRFVRQNGYQPFLSGDSVPEGTAPPLEIAITGIRPGEKLHEELAYSAESLLPTPFDGIRSLAPSTKDIQNTTSMIAELSAMRSAQDKGVVLAAIRRHVPEMKSFRPDSDETAAGSITYQNPAKSGIWVANAA